MGRCFAYRFKEEVLVAIVMLFNPKPDHCVGDLIGPHRTGRFDRHGRWEEGKAPGIRINDGCGRKQGIPRRGGALYMRSSLWGSLLAEEASITFLAVFGNGEHKLPW